MDPFSQEQLAMMSPQDTEDMFSPLLKLWGVPGLNQQLEKQLAMAQALSRPRGQNHGTVAGNIAGGLGDIVGAIGGGIRQNQLQGRIDANQQAMQDPTFFSSPLARQMLMSQALGQGQASQPKPVAAVPAGGADLMGLFGGMG